MEIILKYLTSYLMFYLKFLNMNFKLSKYFFNFIYKYYSQLKINYY